MKRLIVAIGTAALLLGSASQVSAEQKRTLWDMDRLTVLPPDQVRALFGFSALTSIQDDHSWITNVSGANTFQAILTPCTSITNMDMNYTTCIEKVSYRKTGEVAWQNATLSKVQLGNPTTTIAKGNVIVGPLAYDGNSFHPGGDKATLWSLPGAAHASGNDYLLRSKFFGSTGQFGKFTFKSELIPTKYATNSDVVTQDQLKVEEFPKGFEYKIRLRMGVFNKTLTGWFFGRMTNPTIDRNGPGGYLEITGEPAFVPVGITNDIQVADADKYFDPTWCTEIQKKKSSSAPCGSLNRLYEKAVSYTNEEGSDPANLGRWETAPGGVRTVATLSSWSLDSSFFYEMAADEGANKCTTELYGASARVFQGAVFSNATLFQTSPPSWDDLTKSFTFKVASPHLDERGVPNIGFYTLYIPTEMAKCRWGEGTALAKAEVQIISANGKASITTIAATTEDGNFRFNIAGFGYSTPTIKIRMGSNVGKNSEPMASTPKSVVQIAIKCVRGKTVKKVVSAKPVCPKGYKRVPA